MAKDSRNGLRGEAMGPPEAASLEMLIRRRARGPTRRAAVEDAVSRLVGRLADDVETWPRRDLAEDQIQYLLLDGWYPKVRIGKRARVPVLVARIR
jgi:hypothetical protein